MISQKIKKIDIEKKKVKLLKFLDKRVDIGEIVVVRC